MSWRLRVLVGEVLGRFLPSGLGLLEAEALLIGVDGVKRRAHYSRIVVGVDGRDRN